MKNKINKYVCIFVWFLITLIIIYFSYNYMLNNNSNYNPTQEQINNHLLVDINTTDEDIFKMFPPIESETVLESKNVNHYSEYIKSHINLNSEIKEKYDWYVMLNNENIIHHWESYKNWFLWNNNVFYIEQFFDFEWHLNHKSYFIDNIKNIIKWEYDEWTRNINKKWKWYTLLMNNWEFKDSNILEDMDFSIKNGKIQYNWTVETIEIGIDDEYRRDNFKSLNTFNKFNWIKGRLQLDDSIKWTLKITDKYVYIKSEKRIDNLILLDKKNSVAYDLNVDLNTNIELKMNKFILFQALYWKWFKDNSDLELYFYGKNSDGFYISERIKKES